MDAELIMTVKQMQNHDAWLDMRKQGIGGSDAGAIMGYNPWTSRSLSGWKRRDRPSQKTLARSRLYKPESGWNRLSRIGSVTKQAESRTPRYDA